MISVVVNSLNEAEKLKRCLQSVEDFADEIVVVDMDSTDHTKEIAKVFKAKVFQHPRLPYIEPARKFAVNKTSGDWVLVLDPDEVASEGLKKQLKQVVADNKYQAVNIPRLNIIFGSKIKHTNFWPDRQIRLFKKDKVQFSDKIHSYPKVEGEVLNLPAKESNALYHCPYQTVQEYLIKMKRYAKIEAENRFKAGERFSISALIWLPFYDFARRYIRHLGILDGWNGLLLSLLQAYYYILVEMNLFKL